jgi:hypothetical protein
VCTCGHATSEDKILQNGGIIMWFDITPGVKQLGLVKLKKKIDMGF